MGRSKAATTAQVLQFDDLFHIGCIACRLAGVGWVPPEQDHRNKCDLAGMKRTDGGHDDTLPLCQWHHRGIRFEGYGSEAAHIRVFGPSKHLHKKRFIERFGTIAELYVIRDDLLERYRATTCIRPQSRREPA